MATSRREFLRLAAAAGGAASLGLDPRTLLAAGPVQPLKILVLGGTGFIGPHQVEYAVSRGHQLTLFNRGRTNPSLFPGVEKLEGDRDRKLDALRGRTWDAVIDNSGYVPRHVRDSAQLLKDSVGQYLFISTVGIYKAWTDASWPADGTAEDAPKAPLTEPGSEDSRRHYGPLKVLCEEEVVRVFPKGATLVRPGLIVGPGDTTDRFTYWPVRADRGGEMLAPGTPDDPVLYIDARDLGVFCVQLLERKTTGAFNALGPLQTFTMGQLLDGCQKANRSSAKLTWVDGAFLNEQKVGAGSLFPWVWPKGPLAGASHFRRDAAFAAGLTFRPFAETARDTLRWFKSLPADRQATMRAGLTAAKETEILAAWRARAG
jgi:2'-hydroxyisoflavone reductase